VQGKDYPYLYCVLIAKKDLGLLDGYRNFIKEPSSFTDEISGVIFKLPILSEIGDIIGAKLAASSRFVYEMNSDNEVDVLVIRQHTTRNSGYFTNTAAAGQIVFSAINLAEKLIQDSARVYGSRATPDACKK
jgi:hypothetical protein